MSLKEKVVQGLKDFLDRISESESKPVSQTIKPRDWGYRPLTKADKALRDLLPITHDKMLELSYYLYRTNPIAHRLVNLNKDYVVGSGITFEAVDPRVQKVLETHWQDPINDWELKQHNKALELSLWGEQIYPVFVNKFNGQVRLGYIDPVNVLEVVQNEENVELIESIKLKDERELKVIGLDTDPQSPTFGYLTGEVFYFSVNRVSNASRGVSDLMCLIDWLDAYDRFLYNRVERSALLNNFVWDVELAGFNEQEIEEWLENQVEPKPGTIRAHNQKVKWNAVVPDFKAGDASTEARLILNQILGGAGVPEHWFAPGQMTRATALETTDPTFKRLEARQAYFRKMISFIFNFVIDQAIIAKQLPKDIDRRFTIITPEVTKRDIAKVSNSLFQLSQALKTAVESGWLTQEEARNAFVAIAVQSGLRVQKEPRKLEEGLRLNGRKLKVV